jgi:hypothetical protein
MYIHTKKGSSLFSVPFPACQEIFFDRLTALDAVGQAQNIGLLFPGPWTATQRGGCAAN